MSPGRGTFTQLGADHTLNYRHLEINSTGEILFDTGTFGFIKQKVFRWSTDFSWRTGLGKLKIQLPVIRFTNPLEHDRVRVPQLLWGLGASW